MAGESMRKRQNERGTRDDGKSLCVGHQSSFRKTRFWMCEATRLNGAAEILGVQYLTVDVSSTAAAVSSAATPTQTLPTCEGRGKASMAAAPGVIHVRRRRCWRPSRHATPSHQDRATLLLRGGTCKAVRRNARPHTQPLATTTGSSSRCCCNCFFETNNAESSHQPHWPAATAMYSVIAAAGVGSSRHRQQHLPAQERNNRARWRSMATSENCGR
ncbi:hypothetical protein JKP88DRAFT_254411 [Tribonema minus]|uniref:Uncharacterized protein n=1 Tax=Tribonema minus TaxID=303371 RepID=A0A836CKF1_9STRA|nr:hypothetical protein JKP88DRAFT_254411 [Tribonema minus]